MRLKKSFQSKTQVLLKHRTISRVEIALSSILQIGIQGDTFPNLY